MLKNGKNLSKFCHFDKNLLLIWVDLRLAVNFCQNDGLGNGFGFQNSQSTGIIDFFQVLVDCIRFAPNIGLT